MIIYENEFEFAEALTKLIGVDEDEVSDLIERLDMDELNDLVNATVSGDAEAAKKIIGSETEDVEPHDDEISSLFHRKDKAKKSHRHEDKELGEDTDADSSLNIGDQAVVKYKGKRVQGTVKVPSAPGKTVGVMIDGELKMATKNDTRRIKEGVLGMTPMPGLKPNSDPEIKRIRELAGLPADDMEELPPAAPVDQAPMVPPTEEVPALPAPEGDMGMDSGIGMDAGMGDDIGMDSGMDDMGSDIGDDDFGDLENGMEAPAPMSPEIGMPDIGGDMGGDMDGGSLEDAAALDNAISEIEGMIPNVRINEYKTLVARLEALVAMAKQAGKAALSESRKAAALKARIVESDDTEDGDGEEEDGDDSEVMEDKITSKDGKPVAKKDEDEEVTRKTLMDYVREAEDTSSPFAPGNVQTIGRDRASAIKAFQTRMGPAATPQQASSTFDAAFAAGQIKNTPTGFTMPTMDDQDFVKQMSVYGQANTNGTSQNNSNPDDAQGKGQNDLSSGNQPLQQKRPQGNVQGSSNPAYQGESIVGAAAAAAMALHGHSAEPQKTINLDQPQRSISIDNKQRTIDAPTSKRVSISLGDKRVSIPMPKR